VPKPPSQSFQAFRRLNLRQDGDGALASQPNFAWG
jgi:hypothetical protein